MHLSSLLLQGLNGLASASTLFLVAVGLSLIFGVTRIVNFAHGSFYMLGTFTAYSITTYLAGEQALNGWQFWVGIGLTTLAIGMIGLVTEVALLRRIYPAPELFQLLATFAMVLVFRDGALYVWGNDDLLGPRAPGLDGAVSLLGESFPTYNFLLIVIGPVVLGALWLLLTRTRWGTMVRAATQDREMLGALGVNQAWLFTTVFALGSALAGLAGALQLPLEPANVTLDLRAISDAFVVVVVGGMGSIPGAFLAALLIAEVKALCIGLGQVHFFGVAVSFSKLTLVAEFLVMAVVLVVRPCGLFGRPQPAARSAGNVEAQLHPASGALKWLGVALLAVLLGLPVAAQSQPYVVMLITDILISMLFAASLHFIMGPGGMHSFGHAAYFGLGAYGVAVLLKMFALPMEVAFVAGPLAAAIGAVVFGWFCVRLSGVYLAMLTLAFGQIVWAIAFQWDTLTGGSNGMTGIWPTGWWANTTVYYYGTLACCVGSVLLLRHIVFSPLGYALRAGRDSQLRADAIGIDVRQVQWVAFVIAGLFAGLAGALFVFAKGGVSPEALQVGKSIDGLVMVMLGGVQTIVGPLFGASLFVWLKDWVTRATEYWQALLGGIILALVMFFPKGVVGGFAALWSSRNMEGEGA